MNDIDEDTTNDSTPDQSLVAYGKINPLAHNYVSKLNGSFSPIIPRIQICPQTFDYVAVSRSNHLNTDHRIDKSYWICDYSDDIFQTLRDTELKRRLVCFRSQQCGYRPMLLQLLKEATEKHKLSRTTLHLAVYLLDCFMDNYTIRADKLNLSALTCLVVAAKIEETDVDMPKFSELNKLVGAAYSLFEFKNVEFKVLDTFNFDLIRPTAATFAEYFANSFITLDDYHTYLHHWHSYPTHNNFQQTHHTNASHLPNASHLASISLPCLYNSYEDMLTTLSREYFELIDVSLNYMKFANARPSIVASACIAAVRQLHGVIPAWTPYLIKLTCCTADVIAPFVEAIHALYRLHCEKFRSETVLMTASIPSGTAVSNTTNILCDSPDSGILSAAEVKSDSDSDEVDDCNVNNSIDLHDDGDDDDDDDDDKEEEDDDAYYCMEYPLLAKRRRIF